MSNRTASLLMLFVAAVLVTGVVLAAALRSLQGTAIAGPWMPPAFAVLCFTTVFYVGRRHLLPYRLAASPGRAAATLAVLTSLTLAAALGVVFVLRSAVGSAAEVPSVTLPLWFALLWLTLQRTRRAHG